MTMAHHQTYSEEAAPSLAETGMDVARYVDGIEDYRDPFGGYCDGCEDYLSGDAVALHTVHGERFCDPCA